MHSEHSVASVADVVIVGCDDHGTSRSAQVTEDVDDNNGVGLVESTGRFVRENQARLLDDETGERYALLFSTA